jgi:hypothetical protein
LKAESRNRSEPPHVGCHQLRSPHLELALKQEVFDEGNCARRHWQLYFPAIGWSARHGQKGPA